MRVFLLAICILFAGGGFNAACADELKKTITTQVVTVDVNLLGEPPPYEMIKGLVFIQVYKKPGQKKTKLYHYQLIDGTKIVLSKKLPGIKDLTEFHETHPHIYRLGKWCDAGGSIIQGGAIGGAVLVK
jgi:hypothetical protein